MERFHTDDISLVFLENITMAPNPVRPHYFTLRLNPSIEPRFHLSETSNLSTEPKSVVMTIGQSELTTNYRFQSAVASKTVWQVSHKGEGDQTVWFVSVSPVPTAWPSFYVRWRYERLHDEIFVCCDVRRQGNARHGRGLEDLIGSGAMVPRTMLSERSSRNVSEVRQHLTVNADVVVRIRTAPMTCHLIVQVERRAGISTL